MMPLKSSFLTLALLVYCSTVSASGQTFNPTNVSFGNQIVGNTEPARLVTFTNNQATDLTINGISASGAFAEASSCPLAPDTLASGTSCNISVSFVPSIGGKQDGTLSVSFIGTGSPATAPLSGTGVEAIPNPVNLSSSALSFASQLITTTSAIQKVTLKNGQAKPLTISAISASGDFGSTSNCPLSPSTLAAGSSCTISISFSPVAAGPRTGSLMVTDNARDDTQTARLSGTGTTPIQHVVIIFQENRTPDNLFQGLPGADIATSGINSKGQVIPLTPEHLSTNYDMSHAHPAFLTEYDNGKMDKFDLDQASCSPPPCTLPANPEYFSVDPTDAAPYMQLAQQYSFGDRMFQSNQGPSFPAHQFIFSGTSAPTAESDLLASENPQPSNLPAGCMAPPNSTVALIDPEGNESQSQYPCFEHATMSDLLDTANLPWRYYGGSQGTVWIAPNSINHIRNGPDWSNVIFPSATVLTDIANGKLGAVTWVTPSNQASDHPDLNDGSGPSWVASVVNAIGASPFWSSTAIFISWDDWGGWYDHVPPPIVSSYKYGFRVPLIVVSPFAKPAYVSHNLHDTGSILKFIESTFGLPTLGYADLPADNLFDCFNFAGTQLHFQKIKAPLGPEYFLHDKSPSFDPDND
jgi:phospholipase C